MDLRATREMDDPFFWCMPMGVPRTTPYPFRFVQNYTHKAPTHMFLLHEGNQFGIAGGNANPFTK